MERKKVNKNDWIYLANIMWSFAESNEGRLSPLLKELVIKINNNMEMIIDEQEDTMGLDK
tara:strand:- start:688 stop:867 length:180 start_codon:yes stop_codon:yes gene_type:complete